MNDNCKSGRHDWRRNIYYDFPTYYGLECESCKVLIHIWGDYTLVLDEDLEAARVEWRNRQNENT